MHPKKLVDHIGDIIRGKDGFKYAMLVGNKQSTTLVESDSIHIGLMYFPPGITFPQHAREAKETCCVLSGLLQSGATINHLEDIKKGEFVFYESAAPRVFTVKILIY